MTNNAMEDTVISKLANVDTQEQLEQIRIEYLGKNGLLTQALKNLASYSEEERKKIGAELNQVKQAITAHLEHKKKELQEEQIRQKLEAESCDVTLPIRAFHPGKVHLISQVLEEVTCIMGSMGFAVAEGPDIEDDFHNFTALNIPEHHPAKEMHDTFYLKGAKLLRTHTSPVQIRTMQSGKPPFKIIAPGRTYRCDDDMTHTPMFHQIEGLYIDKNIHMGHLKWCIMQFVKKFFEIDDLPVKFRPSFFPFTEPSAEVDIGCKRNGSELKIGKGNDWLEILGCGMVHRNVLKNVGVDPEQYQGFAFGMGLERLAMLKYGASDLRMFFENDVRWLGHYGFSAFDVPSLIGGLSR
jgi:phenylalanyl-tRNA synthetase alpha chain